MDVITQKLMPVMIEAHINLYLTRKNVKNELISNYPNNKVES